MRCFIYTGGEVFPDRIEERPAPGDLVIAADSGLRTAELFGVSPSLLLGDFDSLGTPPARDGLEILRVPAEKDVTDTQLAVEVALSRGADDLVIVGGLGGRLDHSLSNLAILERLDGLRLPSAGVAIPSGSGSSGISSRSGRPVLKRTRFSRAGRKLPALLVSGSARVRFLRDDSLLLPRDGRFRFLSLIAADRRLSGVTLRGVKYPLENARINRTHQFAVSNEITSPAAFIDIRRGGAWILECGE